MVLGCLIFPSISLNAQCSNVNGDLETYTGPISTPHAVWINNNVTNWFTAHGAPVFYDNDLSTSNQSAHIELASSNQEGSGVYTEQQFYAGISYHLSFKLWREDNNFSSNDPEILVRMSNILSPGNGSSSVIPSAAGSMLVAAIHWNDPGVGNWTQIDVDFTPNMAYSQLWFYPDLYPNVPEQKIRIDDVCITMNPQNDPCFFDINAQFERDLFLSENQQSGSCSESFKNTTPLPSQFILKTSWDFGDGNTAVGNNVDHYFANPGTYNVCMTVWTTDGEGCCKKEVCQEIVITETCDPCELMDDADISITGSGTITFGSVSSVTVTGGNGTLNFSIEGLNPNVVSFGNPFDFNSVYGYYWDFGDGTFASGETVSHTYSEGLHILKLTIFYVDEASGQCCSRTIGKLIDINNLESVNLPVIPNNPSKENATGVFQVQNEITVYPNPSDGEFTVQSEDEIIRVIVFDNSGKKVVDTETISPTLNCKLNLSSFEKGVYFISVIKSNQEQPSYSKIIIK